MKVHGSTTLIVAVIVLSLGAVFAAPRSVWTDPFPMPAGQIVSQNGAPVVAPSITDTGLGSGLCVQTTTGGLLSTAAAACGTSSGTVTVTGTPVSGNLSKFSGATSITNADLSGDITTSGGTVTTLATVVTAATNTKITYNAKGLVTAGAQAQFSDIGGTATDGQLANAYSGVGSCGGGQFVNALSRNAAPGCATPPAGVTEATMVTPGYVPGNGANNCGSGTTVCGWYILPSSHTLIRVVFYIAPIALGCSTFPTYGVRDISSGTNLYTFTDNGTTGVVDSGALNTSMTAGHTFAIGNLTASFGCTQQGAAFGSAIYK